MQLARAKTARSALVGAGFFLAGCATTAPAPAPTPVSPPPAAPASPSLPSAEQSTPPVRALPPVAMQEAIQPPPPPPAPPPPPPPPPPTDAQSLRAAYGAPDFVRKEMDSELWRYDGRNCAAFFFLYREGQQMRIRYSETNPRGKDAAADPGCLDSLSARPGASLPRPMF